MFCNDLDDPLPAASKGGINAMLLICDIRAGDCLYTYHTVLNEQNTELFVRNLKFAPCVISFSNFFRATQSSRFDGTRTNMEEVTLDVQDINPERRDDRFVGLL